MQHGGVFSIELLDERPGFVACQISGKGAEEAFRRERGGHRVQRVPPTERRGRRQTSTITVAVMPSPRDIEVQIEDKDLVISKCRGSGAGGQHRNVTDSAVQITHKPSGITIRCENERSQHQNKALALSYLKAKLYDLQRSEAKQSRDSSRKAQIGSGMRGDKVRTVAVQRGTVTDHNTNKTISYKKYVRGDIEGLW